MSRPGLPPLFVLAALGFVASATLIAVRWSGRRPAGPDRAEARRRDLGGVVDRCLRLCDADYSVEAWEEAAASCAWMAREFPEDEAVAAAHRRALLETGMARLYRDGRALLDQDRPESAHAQFSKVAEGSVYIVRSQALARKARDRVMGRRRKECLDAVMAAKSDCASALACAQAVAWSCEEELLRDPPVARLIAIARGRCPQALSTDCIDDAADTPQGGAGDAAFAARVRLPLELAQATGVRRAIDLYAGSGKAEEARDTLAAWIATPEGGRLQAQAKPLLDDLEAVLAAAPVTAAELEARPATVRARLFHAHEADARLVGGGRPSRALERIQDDAALVYYEFARQRFDQGRLVEASHVAQDGLAVAPSAALEELMQQIESYAESLVDGDCTSLATVHDLVRSTNPLVITMQKRRLKLQCP